MTLRIEPLQVGLFQNLGNPRNQKRELQDVV
jgi:hypothetical protein